MSQLSLMELFQQDPLGFSKQEKELIVKKMREMRSTLDQTGTPAKNPAKAKNLAADPDIGEIKL